MPNSVKSLVCDEAERLATLLSRPAISPDDLLKSGALPISRATLYQALQTGEIENFRVGRRFVIPTAPLRKKLGIQAA